RFSKVILGLAASSWRPGSNRRRPAWEAVWALAGKGFLGGGRRIGITQYRREGGSEPQKTSGRTVSRVTADCAVFPDDMYGHRKSVRLLTWETPSPINLTPIMSRSRATITALFVAIHLLSASSSARECSPSVRKIKTGAPTPIEAIRTKAAYATAC